MWAACPTPIAFLFVESRTFVKIIFLSSPPFTAKVAIGTNSREVSDFIQYVEFVQ
jgi:hypothetical protein